MRAQELRGQGTSPQALVRATHTGELTRVRHGAYVSHPGTDDLSWHLQLVAGTWPLLGEAAVLSHATAGAIHDLPLWAGMLDRVTITRPSGGHGRSAPHLRVRLAPLTDGEVVEVDGLKVTTLERTALDLARTLPYERAVAVLDSALHRGAGRSVMVDSLVSLRGFSGVGTARAALAFADGRAESVAESISRIRLHAAGIPAPELQVNVYDEDGFWIARSDFGWLALGVLGEFDGKVKYRGSEDEVAGVVMREKRREENLEELGWSVVRWGWDQLDPATLRRRFDAAVRHARPAEILGHAVPLARP